MDLPVLRIIRLSGIILATFLTLAAASAVAAKEPFKWPVSSSGASEDLKEAPPDGAIQKGSSPATSDEPGESQSGKGNSGKGKNSDKAADKGSAGEGGEARKADSQSKSADNDKAASASEEAKTTQPDDKRPYAEAAVKHYNRGVELHQSGFLNQAVAEYRGAIDADSRMEEAYSNLGLIYAAQRNYSKAIDAFSKALALKPGRPTTLNGLGTVLYARGKVKEAMEKWKQAIEADPNFASAYYNMGNAYENEKDPASALDAYVKAIRINPGMADAFYRVGTLLNRDKHAAPASVLLSKAVELAPDADFARDAKKQLAGLESQLTGGTDEPEVEMNVLPPPSGASLPTDTPKAQDREDKADRSAASQSHEGNKPKVDMFIQPAQTEQTEAK
jgi:tetratricopeptide (TPR) repeat protein